MERIQDHPVMIKRLYQILWIWLVGLATGALISWLNTVESNEGISFPTLVLLLGVLVLFVAACLYKLGKRRFASLVTLWTISSVLMVVAWLGDGLQSITLMLFPVILLLVAAYSVRKQFFPLFSVLFLGTFFFGLNGIYNWFPLPPEFSLEGPLRLAGFMLVITISGLLVWLVREDLRYAFTELENEKMHMTESNKQIKKLADHDLLTGLLSYQAATDNYQTMLQSFIVGKEKIVFYFINVDDFKWINDVYGHSTGDELLVLFGQRLMTLNDDKTVIARVGGDEFVVFKLLDLESDTESVSKQIIKLISEDPYKVSAVELQVVSSVGVYSLKNKETSFEDVVKKSEMAMIQAKQSETINYHCYDESFESVYMTNLNMVNGLKHAVSEGLFDVNFLPRMDLETNQVAGAGAQLSWARENPNKYQLNDFWPVIETTELIHEVGIWLVEQSCIACKEWQENGHKLCVSVPLSAVHLTRSSFTDEIAAILERIGLEPSTLVLGVPEHSLYDDEMQGTEFQLSKLKELGVALVIGGFGNGYSNLSRLTKLQFNGLSLNENFVSKINTSENTKVVVAAIVDMATQLDMRVSASDITSQKQAELLAKVGCDYGEGEYWSKPITSSQLQEFANSRKV